MSARIKVVKDNFNGFPYELTSLGYYPSEKYPNVLAWMVTKGSIHKPRFQFQVSQWYTFTLTGNQDGDKCQQTILIEGPGLNGWIPDEGYVENKYRNTNTNDCLVLDDFPLRVYTTRDLTYTRYIPLDAVVKNFVFKNIATNTTLTNFCASAPTTFTALPFTTTTPTTLTSTITSVTTTTSAPEPECGCFARNEEITVANDKCILDLGTAPDVSGIWSFTFELKIKNLPNDTTDFIISGICFKLQISNILFSNIFYFENIESSLD